MKKLILTILMLLIATAVLGDETTIYSGANDGYVAKDFGATWEATRTATTGTSAYPTATDSSAKVASVQGSTFYCCRAFFEFDLSGIPAGSTVSSAVLYVKIYYNSFGSDTNVTCFEGTQSSSLVVADYDNFGATSWGSADWANTAGYKTLSLNATGLANLPTGGLAKLCIRETIHDVNGTTPTSYDHGIATYFSERSGTGDDPYIVINYTEPVTYTISGTLKEKTSDVSGAAYNYFILDATNHSLFEFGTAGVDGAYSVTVTDTDDEYCGVIIDNIGGAVYGGNFGTATTNGSGEWSITDAGWAEGETIWAFFVDPDKVYKTVAFSFTANGSNTVADTHNEAGSPAVGTLVYAADFGTSSGYLPPNPIFDFATGN